MELPDTQSLLLSQLGTRLRGHGHLWHRTSLKSLEGILRAGAIVPNIGQLPETFPQSNGSYSRYLNGVSLFDFDTSNERNIFDSEWAWQSVLINNLSVLIRIRRDALDRAKLKLPSEISSSVECVNEPTGTNERVRMLIPAVEAIHIGPIPSSAFSGFILATFKNGGEILWHEAEHGSDPLVELSQIGAAWKAAHELRRAERKARGELDLAELVKASFETDGSPARKRRSRSGSDAAKPATCSA